MKEYDPSVYSKKAKRKAKEPVYKPRIKFFDRTQKQRINQQMSRQQSLERTIQRKYKKKIVNLNIKAAIGGAIYGLINTAAYYFFPSKSAETLETVLPYVATILWPMGTAHLSSYFGKTYYKKREKEDITLTKQSYLDFLIDECKKTEKDAGEIDFNNRKIKVCPWQAMMGAIWAAPIVTAFTGYTFQNHPEYSSMNAMTAAMFLTTIGAYFIIPAGNALREGFKDLMESLDSKLAK